MNFFQKDLENLAEKSSESGSIPIYKISALPLSIQSVSERKTSQRVILYGLFKRTPKGNNFENNQNIFKLREADVDIEDVIPGNWIPTIENFKDDRRKVIDQSKYEYTKEDEIFLEDFSNTNDAHEIKLVGDFLLDDEKANNFIVSGLPGAVIGRFNSENSTFECEKVLFLEFESESKNAESDDMNDHPTSDNQPSVDKKLLILSNLNIGNDSISKTKLQLKKFLSNIASQNFYGEITNIVILGGLLSQKAWDYKDPSDNENIAPKSEKIENEILKLSSLIYNKKIFDQNGEMHKKDFIFDDLKILEYLEVADWFLANLLEMFPVTLFPSKYDMGYSLPPFVGFSREIFKKSNLYKNFRCCNSCVSDMVFSDAANNSNKCNVLGFSHEISSQNNKTKLILKSLTRGELLPGSPYPEIADFWYTNDTNSDQNKNLINTPDPFLLDKNNLPNLILMKNSEEFISGRLVNGLNVVTVPEFEKGLVVYDLKSYKGVLIE